MKVSAFVLAIAFSAPAFATETFGSIYTDLTKDCVTISSSTQKAEIDFIDEECKAFGGFKLGVVSGDSRSQIRLTYGQTEVQAPVPGGFWNVSSDKVEWVYSRVVDQQGNGDLTWQALIYRLDSTIEGDIGTSDLYVIRLRNEKSCFLGQVKTNEAARALAYNLHAPCR